MTPTLRDEFRRLCEDFDSTPKVRLGHDVKQEIVNAIGTAGWEMVGTDFFEFLGEDFLLLRVLILHSLLSFSWQEFFN